MVNIQGHSSRDGDLSGSSGPRTTENGIETARDGDIAVLRFTDRNLDFTVSDRVKQALTVAITTACEAGVKGFVLDLGRVRGLDSCGLALIVIAFNKSSSLNAKFALANVTPFIQRIFEIMRLKKHLALFSSVTEAADAVRNS